ncbi:hypothetical protein EK21DRAFT_84422 [Setomelanomma holmii]|uniref:Uncharacterized protein n=1 Tax=Setomelanomma holmii TaxID=210430 RepID=A0A9P4LRH7_9PLEO|nr:hypothetical protein EK21DRAFT_84422 [Setomelanomma holmii]
MWIGKGLGADHGGEVRTSGTGGRLWRAMEGLGRRKDDVVVKAVGDLAVEDCQDVGILRFRGRPYIDLHKRQIQEHDALHVLNQKARHLLCLGSRLLSFRDARLDLIILLILLVLVLGDVRTGGTPGARCSTFCILVVVVIAKIQYIGDLAFTRREAFVYELRIAAPDTP